MAAEEKSGGQPSVSRKSLRLTFRVSDGSVELLSVEHLVMITPPQAGEVPQAGKHSGFWLELQGSRSKVLAHRLIDPTQLNSVEVHSPDGKIERKFGPVRDGVFEVLLPDIDEAKSVVLMGDPIAGRAEKKKAAGKAEGKAAEEAASGEIARFELPRSGEGR
jgi:hypothetical protein